MVRPYTKHATISFAAVIVSFMFASIANAGWLYCVAEETHGRAYYFSDVFYSDDFGPRIENAYNEWLKQQGYSAISCICPGEADEKSARWSEDMTIRSVASRGPGTLMTWWRY